MLTTEECLLSDIQQRNPDLKREQLEQAFADYFGIKKTIWLGNGVAGDDTHGHVDDISRFVSANTVVTAVEKSSSDPNYAPLLENLRRLREATDQDGKTIAKRQPRVKVRCRLADIRSAHGLKNAGGHMRSPPPQMGTSAAKRLG